jgi:hypothetical protein
MAKHKYKKRPEFYYAIQYDGTNEAEIVQFCPECIYDAAQDKLFFYKSVVLMQPSEWVVQDNGGNFTMMTDEQFNAFFQLDTGPVI